MNPPDNRDAGILEDIIGWIGWPAAVVVVAIIAAFLYSSVDAGQNKSQLRKEIITACANKPNVPACVQDFKKNLP